MRPNIVIGGVNGLAERDWPGYTLRIGSVLIGIHDLRCRCIMTTYDLDTLEQIIKQLTKLIDVVHAIDHTGQPVVETEIALAKLKAKTGSL